MFFGLLLRPRFARKLGTLVTDGYLARTGWVRSVLTGRIVDAAGEPTPWMSRPFIDFAAPRLHKGLRLFEYGAGASTLFWAQRVGEVLAVEHDGRFAEALAPKLPTNARVVVHPENSAEYPHAVAQMEPRPDVVIVDGIHRTECARFACGQLAAGGVLVLDDSELPVHASIREQMAAAGFRAIDFWGLAPTRIEYRCTTVFYRSENCGSSGFLVAAGGKN